MVFFLFQKKICKKVYKKYCDSLIYFQKKFQKEIDANFIIMGLCFPVLFSTYRFFLGNSITMFNPFFGFLILNKILEPFFLVILPCYLVFIYTRKKSSFFYLNFWSKISFIFPFLLFSYRVILFFCKNIIFGCAFIILFFFLYLFCLFLESSLIYLKFILLAPVLAFRVFLNNTCQNSWLFLMHPEFLFIKSQLKEPEIDLRWHLLRNFSILCALCLIYFDFLSCVDIKKIDHLCVDLFEKIEKQILNLNNFEIIENFEDLKKEKEEVFNYYYRKHFYSRASACIFESFKKTSKAKDFYKKIENFMTNL